MTDRFAGNTTNRTMLEAIKDQKLIAGNYELAAQIASIGELVHVPAGTAIIQQGDGDSDFYLILAGSFDIVVNERVVAGKFPTDHVGEMVAIQGTRKRSATVVAREPSVVVKLSEPQFAELSAKYPQMLLYIAKEIAGRLEQRNARFQELFGMV
ncbi:MAG TPA: cyclic nucleotide-binding domain-containing protein [Candidatus Acidoferrales bacterium]|nr:cyclic nucleotide-binding domain-containing protein [Candidatus Acidoferrales bacterium]